MLKYVLCVTIIYKVGFTFAGQWQQDEFPRVSTQYVSHGCTKSIIISIL